MVISKVTIKTILPLKIILKNKSTNPSIIYTAYLLKGWQGSWSESQLTSGDSLTAGYTLGRTQSLTGLTQRHTDIRTHSYGQDRVASYT